MKRIIVNNSMLKRIEGQLSHFPSTPFEVMEEDEFLSQLPEMEDTIILGYGYELYEKLRELHDTGKIHIGLRNFRYSQFCELSSVHIGTNKLIFGKYPINSNEAEICEDGTSQLIDVKLKYFLSDKVLKEPLKLPDTHIVGIKTGIDVLKAQFLPYIGEEVGFDFESSGFPEEVGFKISGFALASKKRMVAYFFDFRKDYGYIRDNITPQNQQDYNTFLQLTYQYLKSNEAHVWTYNCGFEILACKVLFHDFLELQDAYALTICDDKRGSLKYNVQYYLNSPSWDDSLDKQQEYISHICKYVHEKLISEGNLILTKERELDYFNNMLKHWNDIIDSDSKGNPIYFKDEHIEFSNKKIKKESGELLDEAIEAYRDVTNEDHDEWIMMIHEYWNDAWMACNANQLGIYCCYDSFYTVALAELLSPAYKDITLPNGNKCQGPYKTFLYNRYMGVELKGHGIVIDVDRRDKFEDWVLNLEENCQIYLNKLYLDLFLRDNEKYFTEFIPGLSDIQKRVLGLDENYKVYFDSSIVSADTTKLGKSVLTRLLTSDLIQRMDDFYTVPHDLLNELLMTDYSDEFSQIDSFIQEGYKSLMRKRGYLGKLGQQLYEIFELRELRSKLNRKILEIVRDAYNEYISKMRRLWAFPNVPLHNAKSFFDCVTKWTKKYKGKLIIYNEDLTIKDSLKSKLQEFYPDITDPEVSASVMVPQDIIDGVLPIKNINDEDAINEFIDKELKDWIPKEVLDKFTELPTAENFFRYCEALREFNLLKSYNNKILDSNPTLDTNNPQAEKYINWYSSDQIHQFIWKYKKEFYDWVYMIKCYYDIKEPSFNPAIRATLSPEKIAELEAFSFDNWVSMYKENMNGLIFYGSDKWKELYCKVDKKTKQLISGDEFLMEHFVNDSFVHLHDYNILKLDLDFDISYPEKYEYKLAKFITCYNLGAAARKIKTNYIKAMHEEVAKPHSYGYGKYIQIERVNGWDKNERDLRLYYKFNINAMSTKRSGSGLI